MKKTLIYTLMTISLVMVLAMPVEAFAWPWSKKADKIPNMQNGLVQQDLIVSGLQLQALSTCLASIGIEPTPADNQALGAISQIIEDPYCCSISNQNGQEMIDCLKGKLDRLNSLLSWLQSISSDIGSIRNSMCDQTQGSITLPMCALAILQEGDSNQDKISKLASGIRCQMGRARDIYFNSIPQGVNEADVCIASVKQCYQASGNYDATIRAMIENKRDCLGQWIENLINVLMTPMPGCTPQIPLPVNCTLDPPLPLAPSSQQQCF